jgi:glycosyltransferase 2 family protein
MRLQTVIGIAVSALLLYLAARNVRFAEVLPLLRQANFLYLALAGACAVFAVWLRAWRWRYLMPNTELIKTGNLFSATMIGFMGNNLLPLRIGDLARAYIAAKKENTTASAILATVVIERLFDVFAILVMLSVIFFHMPLPRWIANSFLLMLALGALAWIALLSMRTQAVAIGAWTSRLMPAPHGLRIEGLILSFFAGLAAMRNKKHLAIATLLSIPIWTTYALGTYAALKSCAIAVPFSASWVVLAFVGIGVSLPSAPGFVGTFQFFTVAALALFSVDPQTAFGYSLLHHLSQYIPVTLFGWILLVREQMSLGDLAAIKTAE